MKQYKVQYGQSIYDIGVQLYGHITGAEILVKDNPQYSLTSVPIPGEVLLVRDEVPQLSDKNEAIAAEYAAKGMMVASAQVTDQDRAGAYVAEGYWANGYVRNEG